MNSHDFRCNDQLYCNPGLVLDICELEKKIMSDRIRPESFVIFGPWKAAGGGRISIPSYPRPPEARQNIPFAVQELGKRYPQGLPNLHPITLKAAAEAVGEVNLENKFGSASKSLRQGIVFANSLYL